MVAPKWRRNLVICFAFRHVKSGTDAACAETITNDFEAVSGGLEFSKIFGSSQSDRAAVGVGDELEVESEVCPQAAPHGPSPHGPSPPAPFHPAPLHPASPPGLSTPPLRSASPPGLSTRPLAWPRPLSHPTRAPYAVRGRFATCTTATNLGRRQRAS